jgi:hypothetical protein
MARVPSGSEMNPKRRNVEHGGRPVTTLSAACQRLLKQIRKQCPGLLPASPVAAGTVLPTVPLKTSRAKRLFGLAATVAAGVDPLAANPATAVTWREGDRELLVRPNRVNVRFDAGVIVVSVPVFCDQTGDAAVHVTFVVGDARQPAGLVAATEARPRGPAIVVDAWADALTAFAWHTVLEVVSTVAGEVGRDTDGSRLVPVALTASRSGLSVTPMARHTFDRERA